MPERLENCLLLLLVEVLLHQLGRAQGMLGIQAVPSQNGPGVPESPMPMGDKLPPQTMVVKEVLDDRHTLGIDFAVQECFDLRQVFCSFDSTQASVLADEELAFLRPVGAILLGCPVAQPFYYCMCGMSCMLTSILPVTSFTSGT